MSKILATMVGTGTQIMGAYKEQKAKEDESTGNIPVAGQEGGSQETLPVEKVVELTVEELAARVEQANLDSVKNDANMALADVMKGWKREGKTGDNCPKVVMVIPCTVTDHKPVAGKGYFCILGDTPAQTRSEFVKYEPEVALSGPEGCGYLGCKARFFKL